MTDDRTLLRRHADDRDESAFAEVVRRNLAFVYSAALRKNALNLTAQKAPKKNS